MLHALPFLLGCSSLLAAPQPQTPVAPPPAAPASPPPPPASAPDPLPSPVLPEGTSLVLIARPVPGTPSMCTAFERSRELGQQQPGDDETLYPERTDVALDVLHIPKVFDHGGYPPPRTHGDRLLQPSIAFANDAGAFRTREGGTKPFDCHALDALFAQPYVVIAAFGIDVDHGNGPGSPCDIGTDASMPNAGFQTLAAAQDWVGRLRPETSGR